MTIVDYIKIRSRLSCHHKLLNKFTQVSAFFIVRYIYGYLNLLALCESFDTGEMNIYMI